MELGMRASQVPTAASFRCHVPTSVPVGILHDGRLRRWINMRKNRASLKYQIEETQRSKKSKKKTVRWAQPGFEPAATVLEGVGTKLEFAMELTGLLQCVVPKARIIRLDH